LQGVAFGLFVTPLYFLWEKLLGTHQSHYIVRVSSRIPVVLVIWFLAVAFPFFGPINSILGALTTTFATYLLPALLYFLTFKTSEVRNHIEGASFQEFVDFEILLT
jgi:auxin influx carrier (AUX1 LAX family)